MSDLMGRVEISRGDLIRARAEAGERVAGVHMAEVRERKLQDALERATQSEATLRERVRLWEGFREESKRQTSRRDEGIGPTRDEPRDGDREA